jgi:hypothetical protein
LDCKLGTSLQFEEDRAELDGLRSRAYDHEEASAAGRH